MVDPDHCRVHVRGRHEVARAHLEAARDLAIELQLGGIGTKVAAAGHGGDTVGDLRLDHDDGRADGRHLLHELEDQRCRHLVGQVRDELVGHRGRGNLAERGHGIGHVLGRDAQGVAHEQRELLGIAGARRGEHLLELVVGLERHHGRAGLQHRHRQGADAGAHLEHDVVGAKLRKVADLLDNRIVDQEVLSQAMLGCKAELLEDRAGRRGRGQTRAHPTSCPWPGAGRARRP